MNKNTDTAVVDARLEWTLAAVGCYWGSGPYYIGTTSDARGPYQLTKNRELIGHFKSLEAAQYAAGTDALISELNASLPVSKCRDCGSEVPELEVFPGPRCLACHAKKFDAYVAAHGLPKPDFKRAVRR